MYRLNEMEWGIPLVKTNYFSQLVSAVAVLKGYVEYIYIHICIYNICVICVYKHILYIHTYIYIYAIYIYQYF